MGRRARRARPAPLAHRDLLVRRDRRDQPARLVRRDLLVPRDHKDHKDQPARLARRVRRVNQVSPDLPGGWYCVRLRHRPQPHLIAPLRMALPHSALPEWDLRMLPTGGASTHLSKRVSGAP